MGIKINRLFTFRSAVYAMTVFCSLLFLFPIYMAVANALSPWYSMPTIKLTRFRFENFAYATTLIDFWKFTVNSFILCAITVGISTMTSGLVGYAFARIKAPGRGFLFMIVLSTMMLPAIVTQIPTYILYYRIGFIDTFWPWVLTGLGGNAFYIFLYRQFFSAIPKELEDAARIDGCSIFRTYWNIFLPLSLPAVATVAIMTFHGAWGDVITPFMYLRPDHYPLATALSMINYEANGSNQIIQQVAIAAGILFMIPVMITFFLGQKHIVEGIVTTGVKG
jgi:ABC-type glycerol-3-phosphate transport system permease component